LAEIEAAGQAPNASAVRQQFAIDRQQLFGREVLDDIGFDFAAGRLDTSAHPFTEAMAVQDVRITTHYDPRNLCVSLYANLHEGGHALYEQGLPLEHEGTPLATAVSLGIHESQSRLWENSVGRSREFLLHYLPRLQELFPSQLGSSSAEDLYQAVNAVQPSLIRIEADEVTYNLHILMRWELERALLRQQIEVGDLPGLWKEKMRQYLGLQPASDAQGVLQDIHWAFGVFGYFPTYTLGNLYAAQFYRQAAADIGDLSSRVARGEFQPLLAWLREKIHRQGSLLWPQDLCREVTGSELSIQPFASYLRHKFGEIYNL
jgi:carboxypeptidase Taq